MKKVIVTLSVTSLLCTAAVCHAGVIRISTFSGAGDAVTRNVASSDEVRYDGYAVVGSEIVLVGFGGGTTVGGWPCGIAPTSSGLATTHQAFQCCRLYPERDFARRKLPLAR